jgi:hypothetical protein
MLKKSLIILGTFLYFSVLITGSPFKVDIISHETNPFFSLDHFTQFVYAQSDNDKSDNSSSDKSDSSSSSSSDKSDSSSSDKSDSSSSSSDKSDSSSSDKSDSSSSSSDKSNFKSNDASDENSEKNSPDFLSSPAGDISVNPSTGGEEEDNQPPTTGGGEEDNPESSKDKNNIKDKINLEFEKMTKIVHKTKTKVIFKDDNDREKEIMIVTDPTCPTQSETIALNGIIDPQGIRLLANFYPCIIENGGITMNIPESPHLKLALIYIDNNIDNHAGTLITPSKIQSLDEHQGLFSVELDKKMKGNDPITGELTQLEKINGLALYNNGNEPIEFKEGSSVALTATFTR